MNEPNFKVIIFDEDDKKIITEVSCSGVALVYKDNNMGDNMSDVAVGSVNMNLGDMVGGLKAISLLVEDLTSDVISGLSKKQADALIKSIGKTLQSKAEIREKTKRN